MQVDTLDLMVQKHSKELRAPYSRTIDCYGLLADKYYKASQRLASHSKAEALMQASYDKEYQILNPICSFATPVGYPLGEYVNPLYRRGAEFLALSEALTTGFHYHD